MRAEERKIFATAREQPVLQRSTRARAEQGLPSAACILEVIESDFSKNLAELALWWRRLKHHARSVLSETMLRRCPNSRMSKTSKRKGTNLNKKKWQINRTRKELKSLNTNRDHIALTMKAPGSSSAQDFSARSTRCCSGSSFMLPARSRVCRSEPMGCHPIRG